jgi:outer membrane protein
MKKVTLLLVAVFAMMSISAQSQKFGHVDSQKLMQSMPAMDSVMSDLEDIQTSNNELLKSMQDEMQKQLAAYQEGGENLLPAVKAAKEQELQQMQENIQTFYQQAQVTMQTKQQELTKPVMDKAKQAIEDVAKEQGLIYVFDLSGGTLLYHSIQSVDILPLVRKKLGMD